MFKRFSKLAFALFTAIASLVVPASALAEEPAVPTTLTDCIWIDWPRQVQYCPPDVDQKLAYYEGRANYFVQVVQTDVIDVTLPPGFFDALTTYYGVNPLEGDIGPYAALVMVVRDNLGIPNTVDDLSDAQDDQIRVLVDQLLLDWVNAQTAPTVAAANGYADYAVDTVNGIVHTGAPVASSAAVSSSYGDAYDEMNEQEKRVCRHNPRDCYESRNAPGDSFDWQAKKFPRGGHNDRADAFRHCMWSGLMVKRSRDYQFAEQFGNAHEYGAKGQPVAERDMDLYNNDWGRFAGDQLRNSSDRAVADRCAQYANNGTLRTLQ